MNIKDRIYKGDGTKKIDSLTLENAPIHRFEKDKIKYRATDEVIDAVNTAIYLRRPLLVSGKPGLGKSTLAKSVANDLGVEVISWRITSKSTLENGLYSYDAIGRLHDSADDIAPYIKLGPLGSAFAYMSENINEDKRKKYVLLIDEIDKSDIDLPNDLLHILEELEFEIPELKRVGGLHDIEFYRSDEKVKIRDGKIKATDIPIIIMTSNDTREFPTAFLRRTIQTTIQMPKEDELVEIVKDHYGDINKLEKDLISEYYNRVEPEDGEKQHISIDQLLNAIYLLKNNIFNSEDIDKIKKDDILELIFKSLE